MSDATVHVSYLELTQTPAPIRAHVGEEHIARERLSASEYLDLYSRIGAPLRWDQRLKMPRSELIHLLESERSRIYVLRDHRSGHPEIQLPRDRPKAALSAEDLRTGADRCCRR